MSKRRALVLVLMVGALLVGVLAGCGEKRAAEDDGTWVIGMSQCNLGEPWRVQMNADIEAAAAEHPNIRLILKDAQNKSERQQAQVRELMDQGVDLIIISPKEARPLTAPVADAYRGGIPVIVLDRQVEGDDYTQFIGADNVQIGREAGGYLVNVLGGRGKIVELKGLMTSTPGQQRHEGFMEGIKGSDLDVIFSVDCKWLEPDAQREMNSALERFAEIDAVYAHNDPSAHGAYVAAQLEGQGREKTIKFVGIDALPHEGVRYVRDGVLTATFEYPTGGREAIENALKILNGETVPKTITLGTRIFTHENVERGGEAIE
jgi:ribose transport system substrate-binding protein